MQVEAFKHDFPRFNMPTEMDDKSRAGHCSRMSRKKLTAGFIDGDRLAGTFDAV